ncbi:MAG: hypothetical protein WCO51_09115 [bacterium]
MKWRLLILGLILLTGCAGRKTARILPPPPPPEPWRIVTNNPVGMPVYLANGFLGVRLSPASLGCDAESKPLTSLIATAYIDGGIINTPNWEYLEVEVNGERLYPSEPIEFQQSLDMRKGILRSKWKQETRRGEVEVTVETWLSRKDPHLAATRMTVQTLYFDASITVRSGIDPSASPFFEVTDSSSANGRSNLTARPSRDKSPKGLPISFETRTVVEKGKGNWQSSKDGISRWDGRLESGQTFVITKLARVAEAKTLSIWDNYETSLSDHIAAWEKLWQSDIEIVGDDFWQQRVRSWLFYLYSSASSDGRSIPPMGLSNTHYNGHIFWDADVWMLPVLLPMQPEFAKSLVDYRLRSLGEAMKYAKQTGYAGARFPWEGGPKGEETAGGDFREEAHITGDVAWGLYQSLKWTGMKPTMQELSLLRETANFWVSRSKFDPEKGKYVILQVLSADELELEDNDLYANAIAKWNLLTAAKLCPQPNPKWKQVANRLYLPFDKQKNLYATYDNDQMDHYKQAVALLVIYPLGMPMSRDMKHRMLDFYAPKTTTSGPAMSEAVYSIIASNLGLRNEAWQYFEKSYQDYLKEPMMAFSETRRSSYDRNYFCTGAGGCLQAVLYGFAGIRVNFDEDSWTPSNYQGVRPKNKVKIINRRLSLEVAPNLPDRWSKLKIKGFHLGEDVYNIIITPEKVAIQPIRAANPDKNRRQ